jgi:hypothetical protein
MLEGSGSSPHHTGQSENWGKWWTVRKGALLVPAGFHGTGYRAVGAAAVVGMVVHGEMSDLNGGLHRVSEFQILVFCGVPGPLLLYDVRYQNHLFLVPYASARHSGIDLLDFVQLGNQLPEDEYLIIVFTDLLLKIRIALECPFWPFRLGDLCDQYFVGSFELVLPGT